MKNPSKIIIATCGTRGDIQPLIALAQALGRRGHVPVIAAPPENRSWVEDCRCAFQALGSDFSAMLKKHPQVHTLKPVIEFMRFLRLEARKQLSELPAIVEGADLVLGASLCFGLRSVAELKNLPYGFVGMAPQILPSAYHPFVALKRQKLPPWINRMSWNIARKLDRLNFAALINHERRRLNLAPIKDTWKNIIGNHVIVASDPIIATVPPDVDVNYIQTGYLHLKTEQKLSGRLEAFLAAGPKPIYFGFGSMSTREQETVVALIQTSLKMAGQRGILSGFQYEKNRFPDLGSCIVVDQAPHAILFPRLAAVVHHGGSGTTATAALSGVPQIIVPHLLDQYFWGERTYRCGLGPRPIWRSRLTARRLAEAINESMSVQTYNERATEVAQEIKKQDSLNRAADYVESLLR